MVKTYEYHSSQFDMVRKETFGRNWSVVYVLEGNKETYIGETADIFTRCHQHYKNNERKKLHKIHITADDEFNKSATLDIEALLIQYIFADGKFKLQNGNSGLKNHQYFNNVYYETKFDSIWEELLKNNVAQHSLLELKNSDIFKYSPYKALTDDQLEVAKAITKDILTCEESMQIVSGEPGSGKTILAIYLVKYLQQMKKVDPDKIGLVIPMTSLRSTVKKVFKSVNGLKASMALGPNDVVKQDYDILIVDVGVTLGQHFMMVLYFRTDIEFIEYYQ